MSAPIRHRIAVWRWAIFWRALGESGREHVVSFVLAELAEAEAAARRAAERQAIRDNPDIRQALTTLLERDPEAGRREAERLGFSVDVVDPEAPSA